ncbi:MAG: endoglycoceramidase [Frankiales bacterium]|nr:endoglycoceramidase [Frankiales bacterium]
MRRLLVLALLLTALTAPTSSGAAAGPAVLHREGRFLVDGQGRVVLLHGVNAVWKRAPYVPPATAAGFTAADADWVVAQGFNTVRLGVIFAGVMPQRAVVDQRYLDRIARVVDLLAAREVWVLLDFHQDLYSEKFSGEGFPAWAVHDDGLPMPVDAGFPGNYFQPATSRAFDNFYANVDGVVDLYAQAWKAVAARFKNTSYVLGYDLLNEPWPGTQVASCANPVGCPVFDTRTLQPVYDKVLRAIRSVDRQRIVWVEPHVLFNDGAQTHLGLQDPQLGLSFHQYCTTAGLIHASGGKAGPECGPQGELVFDNADSIGTQKGWATLLTEYGASDDLPDVARVAGLADEHLTGWQYWHYKEWDDPTTESQDSGGQGLFRDDADLRTLKQAKADVLVRPYARAVGGLPTAMRFDPASRSFTLTYTAQPRAGRTEVWLPTRHYPRGYRVQVSGARVVSRPGAQLLLLEAARAGAVTLTVTRR